MTVISVYDIQRAVADGATVPNTARVLASVFSIGVPVKPMNEAFGRSDDSHRY
jgi:hypothetical protein